MKANLPYQVSGRHDEWVRLLIGIPLGLEVEG